MTTVMCINGKMVTVERYLYACVNRAPLRDNVMVQDGWTDDGRRNMVERPNPMTKHCVYTIDHPHDPACGECRWRSKPVRVD